jgi:hypothetical protein
MAQLEPQPPNINALAGSGREHEDQIAERLRWTPKQRLDYLLDILAFEERAHRARRVPRGR